MDKEQLIDQIIRQSINEFSGIASRQELVLLAGTSGIESNYGEFVHQLNGPALGIYQMEPTTHDDIYNNYASYRIQKLEKIHSICFGARINDMDFLSKSMVYNLRYATIMCRLHYARVKEFIPAWDDSSAMANYHKKYYNTILGKTDVDKSIKIFSEIIEIVRG